MTTRQWLDNYRAAQDRREVMIIRAELVAAALLGVLVYAISSI